MGRFQDILKGTRAIKRVVCPIVNGSVNATTDSAEALPQFECGTRVFSVSEQETVYEMALARTKRLGGEEREDCAIYNLSLQLYTVAASYVDPDSDPAAAKLYFGDTIEQAAENILKSELLSRDILGFLAEVHETWQDEVNPQRAKGRMSLYEMLEANEKDVFAPLSWHPAERMTYMHSSACLLVSLLKDKLQPSVPSSGEEEKKPSEPPKPSIKRPKSRTSKRSRI